ncbi:MAG: hypothetical protein RIC55_30710 [Pirellulaceae bacterium]
MAFRHLAPGLWLGCLVVGAAGCSQDGVRRLEGGGRVLLDGRAVPKATISFLPDDAPAANGEVKNGTYRFTSLNGPVSGPQRVLIQIPVEDKFQNSPGGRWEFEFVAPPQGPFTKDFELHDADNTQ